MSKVEKSSKKQSGSKKIKLFSQKPDLEYIQLMKISENQYEDPRKFIRTIFNFFLFLEDCKFNNFCWKIIIPW